MLNWTKKILGASKQETKNTNVIDPASSSRLHVKREDLIALRFQSSGLDFNLSLGATKKAHSSLSGGHLSPFKGRGMDFDEVRPYQAGDDIRNIDWNVTARTNHVHTKIFKEERERPVYLIVDYRQSMHFATRGCLKSVQATQLAILSAWVSADHHNRIGGVIFTDNQQIECRPKAGHKGVLNLINHLAMAHQKMLEKGFQQANNSTQKFSSDNLFRRLKKIVKPGSLLIFVSDFSFSNEASFKHLAYLSRHNDLVAGFIYDPLEVELPPPGQYSITHGTINNKQESLTKDLDFALLDTTNQQFRQSYREQFIARDAYLAQQIQKMGAHFLRLATNEQAVDVLTQLLGHSKKISRIAKNR